MSRILRGAWSRRGTLVTLAAMTAVVVAGTTAVVALARATSTTALVVVPLLLIGVVAVPAIGAEVAESRREEVGLARLRGVGGPRLWAMVLGEPALAVLAGLVVGVPAGWGAAVLLASRWDDSVRVELGTGLVGLASGVALIGLVVAGGSAVRALREPLVGQLRARLRPRAATTSAVFGTLVVAVGAGVAVQRSRVDVDGDPDLLIQLAPALVGLTVAVVAGWLLQRVGRVGATATSSSGFAPFLAMRRLARSGDLLPGVRLVVAAAVVGGLALSASSAVAGWLAEQARTTSGAEWAVAADGEVDAAVALTEELDPDGEHLMAALVVPEEDRLAERRAYVDARRFAAVSGDFLAGTRLDIAGIADLRSQDLADWTFTGSELRLGVVATVQQAVRPSRRVVSTQGLDVTASYVTADGSTKDARGAAILPAQGDRADLTLRTRGCAEGCRLVSIELTRLFMGGGWYTRFDTTPFEVLVDRLELGGRDVLTQDWWAPADAGAFTDYPPEEFDPSRPVTATPEGLALRPIPSGPLELYPGSAELPVLVAGPVPEQVGDPSSRYLVPDVRGQVDALPLVGAAGALADLSTATVGSGHRIPSSELWVLADADTPDDVLDAVATATGHEPRRWSEVEESLKLSSGAATTLTHGTTAVACGLVALLALAAGAARTSRQQRREVASYRLLGVDLAAVRSAGRLEVGALAALSGAFVALGVWLAVRLLLEGATLVALVPAQLVPQTDRQWVGWLVPVLVAVLAVALVGGLARRVRREATAPAVLREEESR